MPAKTPDEVNAKIVKMYSEGNSYRDISEALGVSMCVIARQVKGTRTAREGLVLAAKQGKAKLTDKGRQALRESGVRACNRNKKYWTAPELAFKAVLNSEGVGVRFPELVKSSKGVVDDPQERCIYYQYPLYGYVLDFVDVTNKVAININGDYWHANPILYKDESKLGKTQRLNVTRDRNKRAYLEKKGWKVLDIWECELSWNIALVKNKLMEFGIVNSVNTPSAPVEDWSSTLERLWKEKTTHVKRELLVKAKKPKVCPICGKTFLYRERPDKISKYCSHACAVYGITKNRIGADELLELLRKVPNYVKAGKSLGVTGNAIKKRCKVLGIYEQVKVLIDAAKRERGSQVVKRLHGHDSIARGIATRVKNLDDFVGYTKDANGVLTEVCRYTNKEELELAGNSYCVVCKAARGERKTYKGLIWKREKRKERT